MTNKTPSYQLKPNDFQYADEANIDNELKCSICCQSYLVPVTLKSCHHTFCKGCIQKALEERRLCPLCRCKISSNDLEPTSVPIVINMLNKLPIQCNYCSQTNICRGDMIAHLQRCDYFIVPCPAANIKCPWTGKRRDMKEHAQSCVFQQLVPVINRLETYIQRLETKVQHLQHQFDEQKRINDELRATTKVQHLQHQFEEQKRINDEVRAVTDVQHTELQMQSQIVREQNQFIRVFINNGKPMSNVCTNPSSNNCQIMQYFANMNYVASERKAHELNARSNLLPCSICNSELLRHEMSLHHCEGGCICRKCVEKYSQKNEESDRPSQTSFPPIRNPKLPTTQCEIPRGPSVDAINTLNTTITSSQQPTTSRKKDTK